MTAAMSKKRSANGTVAVRGPKKTKQDWRQLWLCLGLGLLILIPYANSFSAGLLFDSDLLVRQDPRIRALNRANIEQIFTRGYWWPTQENILYRPLTTLTYLCNYTLLGNGENAGGYHAVNFLLHWANACLVLLIVLRLAGRWDVAALTAALFAVHPVNTESVTNVVGRADLLAGLCVLFGGWCYLRAWTTGTRKRWWLAVMGATAFIGVLTKENAVMIVAFVVLYDFLWRWPLIKTSNWSENLKTAVKEFGEGYAALIPALLLIWLIRRWMVNSAPFGGEIFLDNPLMGAPPFQSFMTAMGVIARYLKLLVFPWNLSSDYSFNQIPLYGTAGSSGADTIAWVSLIAVTLLLGAAVWMRRMKFISWGILFFFVMMLPTSNVLVTIGSIMAERFLYLPSIGFCAVAALALCRIGEIAASFAALNGPATGVVYWILPVLVISILSIRTFLRNADWHDDLSLWKSTVATSPGSFKAHMAYGDAIWTDAQQNNSKPPGLGIDEAIAQEEIALSILEPEPPIPLELQSNSVYLRLGRYYRIKGELLDSSSRHDEAIRFYQRSLDVLLKAQVLDQITNQVSRNFKLRHGVSPENIPDIGHFLVYQLLGMTYGKLEQWEQVEPAGRYLQHLAPDQPMGYQLVGGVYFNQGRYSEAAVQFIAGLLIDSSNSDWWTNLSATYGRLGVPDPVIRNGTTISLNPEPPAVRQHVNEAAVVVARLFKEAKQLERARQFQDEVINQYSVPPEMFSRK